MLSSYIKPEDPAYLNNALSVVAWDAGYAYDEMQTDLGQLKQTYPHVLSVSTIGTSELGREVPVLRIGQENARYHVLFQGAIHGREHMTAWLLTALSDYALAHCYCVSETPDETDILQRRAYHHCRIAIYPPPTPHRGWRGDSAQISDGPATPGAGSHSGLCRTGPGCSSPLPGRCLRRSCRICA